MRTLLLALCLVGCSVTTKSTAWDGHCDYAHEGWHLYWNGRGNATEFEGYGDAVYVCIDHGSERHGHWFERMK